MDKGIYTPEIRVFLPAAEKATGRVILACPGGGYSHLALGHEGYDWASFFNEQGIAYAVLKYRMPFGNSEVPQSDAIEALRVIHTHATEWGLNPNDVGIMGSSAGGHLASTVAKNAPYNLRPDFQILFYPVISMDLKRTHRGSVYSLLGKEPSVERQQAFSNERHVNRHEIGPTLLLLSRDDLVVPVSNSVDYFTALSKNDIPVSMHIYPTGGHGWGCRPSFTCHEQMLNDLRCWLNAIVMPDSDAVRVACVGNSITDGAAISLKDDYGYPAVLGKLLGSKYCVRNFGIGGRTMLSKGDRPYVNEPNWKWCKDFNPHVVIIKLGTNDTKPHNWKYKDEFVDDAQRIIDELRALPASPQILLAYPVKAMKDNFGITDSVLVREVRPLIKKLAKKNKLTLIDLYATLENHPECYAGDGIHPNSKGAAMMAEEVAKVIRSIKSK